MLLVIMLVVSLVIAGPSESSLPSFAFALLGVGAWYASVLMCRSERTLGRAARVLVWAATALAVLGILGMDWEGPGLPQKSFATAQLGGVLTLVLPVSAVLATLGEPRRWMPLGCLSILSTALVLTQSRAAIIGVGVALVVLARQRLFSSGFTATARSRVGVLALVSLTGLGVLAGLRLLLTPGAERAAWLAANQQLLNTEDSMVGRFEIWRRSMAMLLDMPVTGIGLNSYPEILRAFYPTIYIPESFLVPHAHNLVLQTALDVGLPGLLACTVLVVTAVRGGLTAMCYDVQRPLAAGLLLGLLAYGIFGLVDVVALGSPYVVVVWVSLGLLGACGAVATRSAASVQASPKLRPPRTWNWTSPPWRWAVIAAGATLGLRLALTPLALNGSLAVLHQPLAGAETVAAVMPMLDAASRLAWGPYDGRAWGAEALAARTRGDTEAELTALAAATTAAPWDDGLAIQLGTMRLSEGDRAGAVAAFQAANLGDALLKRGETADTQDAALYWLDLAQAVDPKDWRAFGVAATVLVDAGRMDRAAPVLAEALRLRGEQPARAAVAARLLDPSAPLALTDAIGTAAEDADLFQGAARVLVTRRDLDGALYAQQRAVAADPLNAEAWSFLGDLWQRSDSPSQAVEARARAAELRH